MKNKRYIHKIKNDCNENTTFIILCGKKSNKKNYNNIPLIELRKRETIIDRQINTILDNYGNSEIIIVSGFEHDKLIKHLEFKKYPNIRIAENKNYKNSDILDAWRFALNISLEQNTYIIHGDRIFTDRCIINPKIKNSFMITHKFNKSNYDLGILHNQHAFINLSYGLPNVWSEIFFITKKDFNICRNTINNHYQKRLYNIESFINHLAEKIEISIIQKKEEDVTTLRDLS